MSTRNADSRFGVARTISALRARVDAWRADGQSVAFVPTMGALHAGHISLVAKARAVADRTVASIFVNPAQFAPHEDLATYPRNEIADCERLQEAGCDLAYLPDVKEIYPPGFATEVAAPDLASLLCGRSRPHFFGGVATVVCKLLNQCRPNFAIFGEKDYQQLLIIKRMVRDLDMDVMILGAPIMREADGLALSSRNAYLDAAEREIAGGLNTVLAEMARALSGGAMVSAVVSTGSEDLKARGFSNLDYLEVRHEDDLSEAGPGPLERPARVFAAAMVGKTRLIDNWPATPKA